MAASPCSTWPAQVVIAIDIDCFYVACERLRDPSLVGKPVGVKQKTILATCSYEARAFGVGKLQGIKEAKKACPDLILVNGEDLSQYRRYSRAITRLVKSIVWQRRVERLGMDELFCDVTDMVNTHVRSMKDQPFNQAGDSFFNLMEDSTAEPKGFHYCPHDNPSLVIPGTSTSPDASYAPQLLAAAHLASYIRKEIFDQLKFTTSAGIAHNKLIAKLVGNLNKPNLQTTWNPDVRNWRIEQENFLAGFEARQLQGFGSAIAQTVKTAIEEKTHIVLPERSLPINVIRENLSETVFIEKFGPKLGRRLWALIHGDDQEPVNPSPEYPAQISVEDSHYGITSFEQAVKELRKLSIHLLQRLREDLTEDIDGNPLLPATSCTLNAQARTYWALYPTNLRLSLRIGYEGYARHSVSSQFPVDALEDTCPAEDRADRLIKTTLTPLLRKLLKSQPPDQPLRITIPDQTIASVFARSLKNRLGRGQVGTSEPHFIELSSDGEESHHEAVALDDSGQGDVKPQELPLVEASASIERQAPASQDDDLVFVGEERPAVTKCRVCGSKLFAFSAEAHMKFHDKSKKRVADKSTANIRRTSKKGKGR